MSAETIAGLAGMTIMALWLLFGIVKGIVTSLLTKMRSDD